MPRANDPAVENDDEDQGRELTLSEAALCAPGRVPYSPHGYIIDHDAKIYALTERHFHGVVLALLYPDVAQAAGYAPPRRIDGSVDVFNYQRFELDEARALQVVRIATSALTGTTYVSTGDVPPSEAQIQAVVQCLHELGLRPQDSLTGEAEDQTVCELAQELRERRAAFEPQQAEDASKGGA